MWAVCEQSTPFNRVFINLGLAKYIIFVTVSIITLSLGLMKANEIKTELLAQQNLNSYFKKKNTCFKQKIA